MRMRSVVLVVSALVCMSACGGGAARGPVAPSTGITVAPGFGTAVNNNANASVSWACFTNATKTHGLGALDCPVRMPAPLASTSGAALTVPNPPTGFSATVSGSVVTLNWTAPATGDAPTSYLVQAGSATGLSDLASFTTGNAATSLAVFNVPPGVYYVRILAINSAGTSGPSNEFAVVVGGTAPCVSVSAPTNFAATVTGSTVVLTWTAPGGCSPTSYVIQAGSVPGASNLANFSTGSPSTTYSATGVASGTYYVRISSAAPGILSGPSAEIVVTVGVPAPATLVASFQFFDPGTQTSATDRCRIVSGLASSPSICEARSTSFPLGTNTIVSYDWSVQYFYGTAKTITQTGTNTTMSFSDTCGGPGSTDDGALAPVTVTLTVTDNLGAKATATSGTGSQPPLFLQLFRC
jgi:hypothetical protein